MKTYRTLLYCLLFLSLSYFQSSGAESCSPEEKKVAAKESKELITSIRESFKNRDVETYVNLLEKSAARCNLNLQSLSITPQLLKYFKTNGYRAEEQRALENLNKCAAHIDAEDDFFNYVYWAQKLGRSQSEIDRVKAKYINRQTVSLTEKIASWLGLKHNGVNCPTKDNINRRVKSSIITTRSKSDIEISTVSEDFAQQLFKEMAEKTHIPFKYPEDGCYARAHEMAKLLEEKCIQVGKVFVEGNLKVETKNSPKGYVEWWYHVAPVILVEKNGELISYVIDPSLFSKAVPLNEWLDMQTKHADGKLDKVYITKRFNYVPSDTEEDKNNYTFPDKFHARKTMMAYKWVEMKRQWRISKGIDQ